MRTATLLASAWVVVASALVATVPASASSFSPSEFAYPEEQDPVSTPTGTELARLAADLPSEHEREQLLVESLLAGHHPSNTFAWKPVRWRAADADGRVHDVVVNVGPDYLSVGTDEDAITAPLGLPHAAVVARELEFWLPTPLLVDRIYEAADHRYTPRPLPPTEQMRTPAWWLWHRTAMEGFDAPDPDELAAAKKKDVVLSARLRSSPRRLAIYGWHRAEGDPIQPLSLFHGAAYADYSHGIRPVAPTMWVDGQPREYADVLKDPVLSALISDEGPIDARAMLATAIRVGNSLGVLASR